MSEFVLLVGDYKVEERAELQEQLTVGGFQALFAANADEAVFEIDQHRGSLVCVVWDDLGFEGDREVCIREDQVAEEVLAKTGYNGMMLSGAMCFNREFEEMGCAACYLDSSIDDFGEFIIAETQLARNLQQADARGEKPAVEGNGLDGLSDIDDYDDDLDDGDEDDGVLPGVIY